MVNFWSNFEFPLENSVAMYTLCVNCQKQLSWRKYRGVICVKPLTAPRKITQGLAYYYLNENITWNLVSGSHQD